MVEGILRHVRYRLWAMQQYPDPELLYARGGIGDVVRHLAECNSAERTKEILMRFGARIDPEALPIGPRLSLHEVQDDFRNLSVGRSAHVGREVFLDLSDEIVVEDSVTIGMRSILLTHLNLGEGYPDKPLARIFRASTAPIVLRRGCSLGAGVIVLKGVSIGEDSVIGAGVVVSRSVPPRTVVNSTQARPDVRIADRWFERASGRK
ncbi:MAG: acyltransferase [Pseudomonadota bacterium]|nr:MAG: hypothetical protein DIU78_08355 [Pseudomonadota bacterium]